VLVGELSGAGEDVVWRAVNGCIQFLPMVDGRAVTTVEGVKDSPVQRAMVECHGSQCGFCTPGFVMSLQGRAMGALGTDGASVGDVLSGNLCRCTGYGPILQAGEQCPAGSVRDDGATRAALIALRQDKALALTHDDPIAGQTRRAFAPRSADDLARLMVENPRRASWQAPPMSACG
jgi:xanthine dehydrogenase small subunit